MANIELTPLASKLRSQFESRLQGDLESAPFKDLDGERFYWKPMTGAQQKRIQQFAEKSTAEGICMHVKTRALDKNGEPIFANISVTQMMNDFDFQTISDMFFAMTGTEITGEMLEKEF